MTHFRQSANECKHRRGGDEAARKGGRRGRRRFLIRFCLLSAASYRETLRDELGPHVGGRGGMKREVFAALEVKDTSGCYAAKKKKCDETRDFSFSSFSD